MASFLCRIGKSTYPHRWRFLIVWPLLIAGMGTTAAMPYNGTSGNFTFPGLESIETQKEVQQRFVTDEDQLFAPTSAVVIKTPKGKILGDPAIAGEVNELVAAIRGSEGLAKTDEIVPPIMAAEGMKQQAVPIMQAQGYPGEQINSNLEAISPLGADRTTGTISVIFDTATSVDIKSGIRDMFTAIVEKYRGNLDVVWSGNTFQMNEASTTVEITGIIVTTLVLIVTFGSFVAAGLPLLSAVIGLGTGIVGIFVITAFTDTTSTITPMLASMTGLAVDIDYVLFILARFRNELVACANTSNLEPKDLAAELEKILRDKHAYLVGLAADKVGSAAVFAGLTALIAFAALPIINIPFLTAMTLAAAFTVAMAVLVAITLPPAVLGLFDTKVFAGRVPLMRAPDLENNTLTMGLKWVRTMYKRPLAFVLSTAVVPILLVIPAASLRLTTSSDGMMTKGSPDRMAYKVAEDAFDPGRNSPMLALVDYKELTVPEKQSAMMVIPTELQSVDGVVNVQVVTTNDNPQDSRDLGDTAQILITPAYNATDERAADSLQSIRDTEDKYNKATGARYSITGVSPIYEDVSQRLSDILLPYIGTVLVLASLLLMLVLRSIWVPFVATIGFALSMAATFGATVALRQEGALGIIDDPQPLIFFLSIMLVGIVFGLAMDYQAFLVAYIYEDWVHDKIVGNAAANGFKHGVRVVTVTVLIMISVFAAFIPVDEPFIKVMDFALVAAVLFDASVVHMTFTSATVFLLGERAWKIPGWSDKIISAADVKGENPNKQLGDIGVVTNTGATEARQHQLGSHKPRTDSNLEGVGVGLLCSTT